VGFKTHLLYSNIKATSNLLFFCESANSQTPTWPVNSRLSRKASD